MAKPLYHVIEPDPSDLTTDCDDEEATEAGKPSTSFDTEDAQDGDVEDGLVSRRPRRKRRRNWLRFWDTMTVRSKQKGNLGNGGFGDGFLRDQRRPRRKGSWYNCCFFGGLSGLCIL
jgi:hypothetical protein